MKPIDEFLQDHARLTRRFFVGLGAVGLVSLTSISKIGRAHEVASELKDSIDKLDSFMTLPDKFTDVSRGNPVPHTLSDECSKILTIYRR